MFAFAPNNHNESKPLFTGRTKDLQEIINLILSGYCIAIFGERRSGKTLTLDVLHDIINGTIVNYESKLIDQTLVSELSRWRSRLTDYKSIFVSAQGTRTEAELISVLTGEIQKTALQLPSQQIFDKLSDLLNFLQKYATTEKEKIIIIIDEMETFGYYKDNTGLAIIELFCNRKNYSSIIFIHAGSYKWKENVAISNPQFRDLQSHYLKSIDQDDLNNYLLSQLQNDEMKYFVVEMSGGKPLYAQFIGETIDKSGVLSIEILLKNIDLCEQIKQNIYEENNLDDESKLILRALAYHPNENIKWLSQKLGLNKVVAKNKLDNLVKFGTVSFCQTSKKYRLVGKFIERYGQEIYDDPTHLPSQPIKKRVFAITRWVIACILILLAGILYFYVSQPGEFKTFEFLKGSIKGNIKICLPRSLESTEKGQLEIIALNTGQTQIEDLQVTLKSDNITYINLQGKNTISFLNIKPNETEKKTIDFQVLAGNTHCFCTEIYIYNKFIDKFNIDCRKVPLKQNKQMLSSILALLGLLFPGKEWVIVFSVIKGILQKDTSV